MTLSRGALVAAAVATQCLLGALASQPARAATIPDYFFAQWTVAKNCAEQHAGPASAVQIGLKLSVSRDNPAADGAYAVAAIDSGAHHWAANWNGLKLHFRPGTDLKTLPADFECIPGEEAASPFLGMSNYAQATEPYYPQAHWYGLAQLNGQLEHILIFPRAGMSTGPRAVIIMQSVNAPGTVQLDDNGVLHMD